MPTRQSPSAAPSLSFLHDASILVTGGTGSFGRRFIGTVLRDASPRRVIVFSRDELKQSEFAADLGSDGSPRSARSTAVSSPPIGRADGSGWG